MLRPCAEALDPRVFYNLSRPDEKLIRHLRYRQNPFPRGTLCLAGGVLVSTGIAEGVVASRGGLASLKSPNALTGNVTKFVPSTNTLQFAA
jgi:hypothetical protein